MHRISTQILFALALISGLVAIFIDGIMYVVKLDVSFVALSMENLREILLVVFILSYMLLIRRRMVLEQLNLAQKLSRLMLLVMVLLLAGFILNLGLSAEYTQTSTLDYSNFHGLLHANLIGFLSILTLVPVLFITRELIFYKQKRTTRLYFTIFIVLLCLSSLYTITSKELIDLEIWNNPSIYNSILVCSLYIIGFFLAIRNDWITYLSRREKMVYFFMAILAFIMIERMRDWAFGAHLKAFSHIVVSFGYLIYYFLMFYGLIAVITLLVHLPTAHAVDRKLREVNSLYDFARMLSNEQNIHKLNQLITQLTAQVLESSSTWLQEYDSKTESLKVVAQINLTQDQILNSPFKNKDGFNKQLLEEKRPVLVNDTTQHPELADLSDWKKDARALIAAPLFSSRGQLLGILYATMSHPYGFDIDDISLLEGFANQTVIAMENAELLHASLEKERLEQELKIARDVQLKLVPQEMPSIDGVELDSYFLTAYEVGGDYYDFIRFSDGKPGVVIGDVSGKGTSAAFYMAEFKGVIQTLARTLKNPAEMICHANRVFYSTIERQSFVTAIIGKFIPEKKRFEFVRAGHTPALYCPAGDEPSFYLQPPGLGIGLDEGTIFDTVMKAESLKTRPGDILVLFTDGLVELRNSKGEEFGEERLLTLMNSCKGKSAPAVKDSILDEVMAFIGDTPLHDDLTLIVVKFVTLK